MLVWAETLWISLGWLHLLGFCVVSVLALWLAGRLLPPVRKVRRQADMAVSPAHLFPLMADSRGQLSWRRDLLAVEELPDGGWSETHANGAVMRLRVLESRPYRRLAVRFVPGRGVLGQRVAVIEALPGGRSRLELEDSIEIANPLRRAVFRLFRDPALWLDPYLADLKTVVKAKRWQ